MGYNLQDCYVKVYNPRFPKSIFAMEYNLQEATVVSMPSLPEEIHDEILVRLPVKSILTCRCVCKFWRAITSSNKFIKNHLNLNHSRTQDNRNRHIIFVGFSLDGYDPLKFSSGDYYARQLSLCTRARQMDEKRYQCAEILGSCNGLICVRICSYKKYLLYIWNPSTGEYRKIPSVDVWEFRPAEEFRAMSMFNMFVKNSCYGFGYDCVRDDYKLVRFGSYEIRVYTLGSGSWSNTQSVPYFLCSRNIACGVTLTGALHWLGTLRDTFTKVIVSFDISRERIVHMHLPLDTTPNSVIKDVGVLRDCLCLSYSSNNDPYNLDIWVMQDYGVTSSWTKMFTTTSSSKSRFSLPCARPVWAFQNGEILMTKPRDDVLRELKKGRWHLPFDARMEKCEPYLPPGRIRMEKCEPEYDVESLVSLNSGTYCVGIKRQLANGGENKRVTEFQLSNCNWPMMTAPLPIGQRV